MASALDILLGERREDVQLDPRLTDPQERRRKLLERLSEPGRGAAARQAVLSEGQAQQEQLARRQQSRVAGTRGPARLLAERAAAAGTAEGGAQIAAQTAAAAARAQQQQEAQDLAAEAALLDQFERGELTLEELREQKRKPGVLSALTTTAGAALGQLAGQPVGGAQLGQAIGQSLQRR